MHFTEYDTRLAAYALIVNDADEVLLSWYNGEGRANPGWTMPGGGVEFDESVADAAVREVHEETGYHVELGQLIGMRHFTFEDSLVNGRPLRSQQFVFSARIIGGELGTTEIDGSTDFARWIPVAEVPVLPEWRADIIDFSLGLLPRSREKRDW